MPLYYDLIVYHFLCFTSVDVASNINVFKHLYISTLEILYPKGLGILYDFTYKMIHIRVFLIRNRRYEIVADHL